MSDNYFFNFEKMSYVKGKKQTECSLMAGASIKHLHTHIIPRYPREIGPADLIAGKRILVEDPGETKNKVKKMVDEKSVPKIE